ncbi:MAG: flagellar hook-basal body complex protein FliE [Desulfohalobiaceae bacterium]
MAISNVAMQAYTNAMQSAQSGQQQKASQQPGQVQGQQSFEQTVQEALGKVNELQSEKSQLIEEFAAGETENVHELMIAMQKASTAMKMTTAVRGKVLEAYKSIIKMPV